MANSTYRIQGQTLAVTPMGGPLDHDPKPCVIADIGAALAAFTRLEYMVCAVGLHINKKEASAALHDPDPSEKFSRMIKLVRKWLSQHPDLAHTWPPGSDFMFDELAKDADMRNALAHNFLHSFDPDIGNVELIGIKRTGKDEWEHRAYDVSINHIRGLAQRATMATRHFVTIADSLFLRPDNDEPQQTP